MYRMSALDELVGESRAMVGLRLRVQTLLQRLSGLRRVPPILLQGETGTGKTFLARLIHRASPRSAGPFVDLNCAAIPETLLESELFGHERFAFTDAKQAKAGLFQTANRGVLFLDEIGLMPMGLQSKLLKAIDEGVVRRVGSTRNESVDVAIITATNEDLRIAMREKRFRPDLYSRIAVLSLELPPLRARESDIVLLAESFLARACVDYGVPSKVLGPDAREALRTYDWPENVRELHNVMERVALEVDATTVTAQGLGLPRAVAAVADTLERDDDEHARIRLIEALRRTKWNITHTAELLGLSRNTVRARIQRYGLRSSDALTQSTPTGAPSRTADSSSAAGAVTSPRVHAVGESAGPSVTATGLLDVRVYTLARFAVFAGDRQILEDSPNNAPARQLLKLLVTQGDHRVPKGQAPEAGEPTLDASRDRLFSAMSALHDAFVEVGGEAMKSLFGDGETVGLGADAPIWIDADTFEHLIAEARRAADPLASLRDANALYLGDYLPDDVSEDWSIARRERLRQTWIELQLLLARVCEQRGELDEAAAALRRLLAKDGADERAAQELVRLLRRRGQAAEARRVHERLIHTLSELGIDPSPGSLKLERELHTDRPKHLPSGTVTFLLTDIEGSSRHWEHDVDAMRAVVARHDDLLSAGIGACSGTIVKKGEDGDSLLAVFGLATDAVVAACRIQRALLAEPWTTAVPIRVRMALHTGDARPHEGDYLAPALTRCARLRAAGHGGQILLTQATHDLVRDALPAGVRLMELGEYHLPDFGHPTRIFQVAGEGLPPDFPPLRTADPSLATPPGATTIPILTSALIGRDRELSVSRELLLRDDMHLLTLTGAPGTGKTRLSLQLATDLRDQFSDGACFVALASIEGPDLVPLAVGHALGLQEGGNRPILDALEEYLRPKDMLLVLDNFEHVLGAATFVADLLETAPRLRLLVTSRAPLHLRAEHEYPVPPLALPSTDVLPPLSALAQCAAVALFVERAQSVKPDFVLTEVNARAVAEICTRLDGLPLAIELAAARSKLLPPQAMLARLGRRLPLLIGGARDLPARQQTLRGAIAWSHDLLDKAEQRLFRRLSVFVGGWTVQAAETWCNPSADRSIEVLEGVASLLDKSLVRQDVPTDAEPRFGMLETIREYGLDQLEASGEGPEMRDRHLDYYLALAEEADAGLQGPQQVSWCDRLEAEHDNIRAAFGWVLTALEEGVAGTPGLTRAGTRLEAGIRLADSLELFWMLRGHSQETWQRVMGLVAHTPANTAARARILVIGGYMAHCLLDHEAAVRLAEEGLLIWRALGDPREIAVALTRRGVIAIWQGDYAGAATRLTEARALFREHGGEQRSGIEHPTAAFLAQAMHEQGDHAVAYALYEESLAEARSRGDRHAAAYAQRHLARLHLEAGDAERAVAFLRESLPPLRELRDRRCTPASLEALAYAVGRRDQWADAARLFAAAEAMRDATGMPLMRKDRARQESERALLESRLGSDALAAAWTNGRVMSLTQAIDYALEASVATRPVP
jgi:transcriptional regulator with AAA-type ATPase domain/predicted ATPase/DNA-binding SARP family transcriptional activator